MGFCYSSDLTPVIDVDRRKQCMDINIKAFDVALSLATEEARERWAKVWFGGLVWWFGLVSWFGGLVW